MSWSLKFDEPIETRQTQALRTLRDGASVAGFAILGLNAYLREHAKHFLKCILPRSRVI